MAATKNCSDLAENLPLGLIKISGINWFFAISKYGRQLFMSEWEWEMGD